MSFTTINKKLAVVPLENKGAKSIMKGGMAQLAQNTEVVVTSLMYDYDTITDGVFLKGSRVVFSGDSCAKEWNRRVLSLQGQEFVLAPIEEVIMIAPEDDKKDTAK